MLTNEEVLEKMDGQKSDEKIPIIKTLIEISLKIDFIDVLYEVSVLNNRIFLLTFFSKVKKNIE